MYFNFKLKINFKNIQILNIGYFLNLLNHKVKYYLIKK